jgi:hypothetical protein
MTSEEAITGLKYLKSIHQNSQLACEALNVAIKALEKQIPKKLIHITRNEHCEKVIGYGCPTCKADVSGSGFYCWKCGQALDWSEE